MCFLRFRFYATSGVTLFDYKLWYETGQYVLANHENLFLSLWKYDFMYPPPCALFLAGASLLGRAGLILLLVAINSVAWFYSARLSALLAGGMNGARNLWLYVIPNLLVIVYIWSSYHLGQPNLVLLALMLGAFVALRANREIIAARPRKSSPTLARRNAASNPWMVDVSAADR